MFHAMSFALGLGVGVFVGWMSAFFAFEILRKDVDGDREWKRRKRAPLC